MMLQDKQLKYMAHSGIGLVPLSLIAIDNFIYFVSSDRIEALNVDNNRVTVLPPLPNSCLHSGVCEYNKNIAVIGGLGNRSVLLYNTVTNSWSQKATLSVDLINIACV